MRRGNRPAAGRSARSMPASWNGTLSTSRSEPLSLPGLAWPIELRHIPRQVDAPAARRGARTAGADRPKRMSSPDRPAMGTRAIALGRGPARPNSGPAGRSCRARSSHSRAGHSAALGRGLPRSPAIAADCCNAAARPKLFGRIERFLRAEARRRLSEATMEMARAAGVTVSAVSVGDARSRWGSCSASGAIRYNWRIDPCAPPHLLRWLVAHEVAHRRHMNHGLNSRRWRPAVRRQCPGRAGRIAGPRAAAEAGRPAALTAGAGWRGLARRLALGRLRPVLRVPPQHFVQPLVGFAHRVAARLLPAPADRRLGADRIAVGSTSGSEST